MTTPTSPQKMKQEHAMSVKQPITALFGGGGGGATKSSLASKSGGGSGDNSGTSSSILHGDGINNSFQGGGGGGRYNPVISNISSLADRSIRSTHSLRSFRSLRSTSGGDGINTSMMMEDGHHHHDHQHSSHHNGDDSHSFMSYSAATDSANGGGGNNKSIFYEAEKEAKMAIFARTMFVVVMIVAATLVAVGTYTYTNSKEQQAFETKFYEYGNVMVNGIQMNAEKTIDSYQSWSLQLTSTVLNTNQIWPYVTIPYFEAQAEQSSIQTSASIIGFSPIVKDIYSWGRYSTNHVDIWAQQSLDEYNNTTITVDDIEIPPYVYHRTSISSSPPIRKPATTPIVDDIYLPLWQVYPIVDNYYIINFDAFNFTFVPNVFETMVESQHPVLSEGFLVPTTNSNDDHGGGGGGGGADGTSTEKSPQTSPESFMAAPIYDNVFGGQQARENKSLVGVLFAFFPWTVHFEHILPEESTGEICVVVRNNCVQPFTFLVQGPKATFVGMDDLHDPTYSDLEVSWTFNDTFYNVENCINSIHLYPTQSFEESYSTNIPAVLTVSAIGIFVFTMIIFAIYDRYSQKWRRKVEIAARRNSAIVQSLFPANVRDRLMGNGDDIKDQQHSSRFNNNASDNNDGQNGGTKDQDNSFVSRNLAFINGGEGMLPKLPDLIPDLRVLTNKIPTLKNLNPMRLLEEITNITVTENQQQQQHQSNGGKDGNQCIRTFQPRDDKPIADLFPSATVLFGDISGFTAWSSQRDPAQVFTLLETIYNAFDRIAKRRKVFKVETIGDCYMAATGLPEPNPNHAVIMAGFSRECLVTMNEVVRDLEARLGPDTSDLAMRFGIHSGPVTAGVLRGEKSRFQLFGDTVNTASRMESTGVRHKVQLSKETADLLISAGKESWVKPRKDLVEAKGKGKLQTYWLLVGGAGPSQHITKIPSAIKIEYQPPRRGSIASNNWDGSSRVDPTLEEVVRTVNKKIERMIDWNVQILLQHLTNVMLYRQVNESSSSPPQAPAPAKAEAEVEGSGRSNTGGGVSSQSVRSSATDFSGNESLASCPPRLQPNDVERVVPPAVVEELRQYVTAVAFLYPDNPFHSFEHASHVTQCVNKLLARLVKPTQPETSFEPNSTQANRFALQIHTFESAADPILRFAVAFSALVHDVEHPGVPNTQWKKENPSLSDQYNGRSEAEKNSVDVALQLLMEPSYEGLKSCLFTSPVDVQTFRKLVCKTIMATDIADKQMSGLRRQRWADQFDSDIATISESDMENRSEMFMECLIQASDVSHTMQHWHIYIKWNERLFHECYHAFRTGRAEFDPSEGWYLGELSFFDFYIIPLIARLKLLEVFGATTDQFMTYALANRSEWEAKGKDIVKKYVATYKDRVFEGEGSIIVT